MSNAFFRLALYCGLCTAFAALAAKLSAADRIFLRNLEFITDRTVVAFDDDRVTLDAARSNGSTTIGWDEIERATISKDKQPQFDAMLKELGTPLYRIRQRLRTGDYAGLLEPAEELYPRFSSRKSETAYMVCQALMWSRLAVGKREEAVEPYLRCYDLLRSRAAKVTDIPGDRRLQVDPKTGFSPELTPVWFDAAAARRALPAVKQAVESMKQPAPAAAGLYYATLALTAGETAEAKVALATLPAEPPVVGQWWTIARAQAEVLAEKPGANVAALQAQRDSLATSAKPAAIYWLGMAALQGDDELSRQDGILELLSLAAIHGKSDAELAAAGLYQAMQALDKLKDGGGSAAVRKELLQNYAGTAHAAKVRAAVP